MHHTERPVRFEGGVRGLLVSGFHGFMVSRRYSVNLTGLDKHHLKSMQHTERPVRFEGGGGVMVSRFHGFVVSRMRSVNLTGLYKHHLKFMQHTERPVRFKGGVVVSRFHGIAETQCKT